VIQTVGQGALIAARLKANQHRIDLLLLEQSRLIAEFVETDHWDDEGSASPYDWIRFNCNLTSGTVHDRAAVGDQIGKLAEGVRAVAAQEIGFAHLVYMARAAEAVGESFDESELLAKARTQSPGRFRKTCEHFRHGADPDAYARDEFEKYERRHLTLSRWEDGSLIFSGVLGPAEGLAFRCAIEPLAKPAGEDDHRTREQRLLDALYEKVTCHGGGPKVAMQVTASVETLLALVGSAGAENEFSLPISSKTVQRWACDCSMTRVLMQDSVVIDVGRAERTITGPRRRALTARDQHCQWPGCDRPAPWCDAHHIVHWIHGGGGEIGNQVLLCHRHHVLVHEGEWQLVKPDHGEIIVIPPTASFRTARGPD
jgi:hypothetical protein